ncbi:hypothetical protein [Roseococcus sp.]|uniref:hypothetical protein n=1 Tax=Roseococcus sp. TaxID=2109646 RepID=UPI003BA9FDED
MARPHGMTEQDLNEAAFVAVWEVDGPRVIKNVLKNRNGQTGKSVEGVFPSRQFAEEAAARLNAKARNLLRRGLT